MLLFPSVLARSRSAWVAASVLGVSVLALIVVAKDERRLSAVGRSSVGDLDRDGLTDAVEQVLGTQPGRRDSDADGYSDLEEFARGSDPASAASIPEPSAFGLAMGGSQSGEMVDLVATVFADASMVASLSLEFGVVHQGRLFRIFPRSFGVPRAALLRAAQPGDRLAVIEFPLPVDIVRRVGQVNVVAFIRDTSTVPVEPSVSILTLVNFEDTIMSVHHTPATLGAFGGGSRPAGIVYRPLTGNSQIPSTWNSGEICFQRTAAVGVDGASIVYEVEAAGCLPMDTYCSPGNCSARVGTAISMPDPGALLGG